MSKLLIILIFLTSCTIHYRGNMQDQKPDFNQLWNYQNPKETRANFIEFEKKYQNEMSLDERLQLKTQIARTHSLKSEFDEAHKILDGVKLGLTQDTHLAKVRYLLERGRTFNSNNEKDKANKHFVEAFELSQSKGFDNYTIDAAHMVAIAQKDLDEKIKWNDKGALLAHESEDKSVKRWVGVFYNNSGWDLFEAKRYEEALEKFKKCQKFYENIKNQQREDIAWWSIAKTYRLLNKIDDSLEIQTRLLKEKNGEDSSGYTFEELGELYLIKGEKETAKSFFKKAYEILSKDAWMMKNEAKRMTRMKELSL